MVSSETLDDLRPFDPATHRSIAARTMGVGLMVSRSGRKTSLQILYPRAPTRPLSQQIFVRYEDETEAEALTRHGLDEWPEDATIVMALAGDLKVL